jgi:hypothetical protein
MSQAGTRHDAIEAATATNIRMSRHYAFVQPIAGMLSDVRELPRVLAGWALFGEPVRH